MVYVSTGIRSLGTEIYRRSGRKRIVEEKNAYQEKFEATMKEWKAKIEVLEAKAEQAKADTRIEYQNTVRELKEKQRSMRARLDELKESGESAWKDLRAGLEKAKDDLKAALDRALDKLK